MFWGYFDESYQHDKNTGHAVRCTLGGCIAPCDNWLELSLKWSDTLRKFNVSTFHMKDFEADRGEFKDWKKNKPAERRQLLQSLLNLMVQYVTLFVATTVDVKHPGRHTRAEYQKLVKDIMRAMGNKGMGFKPDEKITIVYARHNDFSKQDADTYRRKINQYKDRPFVFLGLEDPRNCPPLQAADIFAYEMARHLRYRRLPNGQDYAPARYPFMWLIKEAAKRGSLIRLELFP